MITPTPALDVARLQELAERAQRRLQADFVDIRRPCDCHDCRDWRDVLEALAEIARLTAEREAALPASPLWFAALAAKLKAECEKQHARAEAAEGEVTRLRAENDALRPGATLTAIRSGQFTVTCKEPADSECGFILNGPSNGDYYRDRCTTHRATQAPTP